MTGVQKRIQYVFDNNHYTTVTTYGSTRQAIGTDHHCLGTCTNAAQVSLYPPQRRTWVAGWTTVPLPHPLGTGFPIAQMRMQDLVYGSHADVDSSRTVIRRFSYTNVSTAAIFSSVMTDTCPGRGRSAVDTRPPRNSTHHLNTMLRFRHASPYTSFIRHTMSLGDAPSLHRNWMTPRCTCLDASIRRTCCYNFHHYAAHTCRRLTLFCAGTANSRHHVAAP
jgi:hypothetical protein